MKSFQIHEGATVARMGVFVLFALLIATGFTLSGWIA